MSDKVTGKLDIKVDATPAPPPVAAAKYETELASFKNFCPNLRKDMGYIAEDDPRVVRNVPADMTVTWATDPRVDNGQHLGLVRGLGFRPVRVEEVTTGFDDADKMVLRTYEVGPHDYVVAGGGVLMVGYRQYRNERRAAARAEALSRLDDNSNRLDSAGVRQQATASSGPISEV